MMFLAAGLQQEKKGASTTNQINIGKGSQLTIENKTYRIGRIIGEGEKSKVFNLILDNKVTKVIKIFNNKVPLEELFKEQEAMSLVCSTMIIDNHNIQAIIMDKIPGRELFDYLPGSRYGNLTVLQKIVILNQMVRLMQTYHMSSQIIHRDLKPENVMVAANGNYPICTIIDFGFAMQIENTRKFSESHFCGTHVYIAPESRPNSQNANTVLAGSASDVFSLATIASILFYDPKCAMTTTDVMASRGQYGFTSDDLLKNQELLGNHNQEQARMPDLNNVLHHFLAHMLNQNPEERATIIVAEAFFHSLQQLSILSNATAEDLIGNKDEKSDPKVKNAEEELQKQLNFHIIRLRLLANYPNLPENYIPECQGEINSEHEKFLIKEIPPFNPDITGFYPVQYLQSIGNPEITEIPKPPKKIIKPTDSKAHDSKEIAVNI
jgi:serine/threonine protein kinase